MNHYRSRVWIWRRRRKRILRWKDEYKNEWENSNQENDEAIEFDSN